MINRKVVQPIDYKLLNNNLFCLEVGVIPGKLTIKEGSANCIEINVSAKTTEILNLFEIENQGCDEIIMGFPSDSIEFFKSEEMLIQIEIYVPREIKLEVILSDVIESTSTIPLYEVAIDTLDGKSSYSLMVK